MESMDWLARVCGLGANFSFNCATRSSSFNNYGLRFGDAIFFLRVKI